jgi:hypothetical protein
MSTKPRLSALAQLCAMHIANGITTTKALAEKTQYTERQIWRAKRELATLTPASVSQESATLTPASLTNLTLVSVTEPRVRARIETPSGLLIPKLVREDPPLPPSDERVAFASGKLTICAELRKFWLDQFGGDATLLDLALIQAAGYVQTSSGRPLEAQVASQLARKAADKREKDQRYREAAARNAKAASPAKPSHMARY